MTSYPCASLPHPAALLQQTVDDGIDQFPDFNLHALARAMFMSRYTLHRHCVSLTGLSPGRLILQRRLEKARTRLQSGAQPISGIAYDLGFISPARFSAEFKKAYGLSPRTWKAQVR
jgi:AraC-like DNA-binding protein